MKKLIEMWLIFSFITFISALSYGVDKNCPTDFNEFSLNESATIEIEVPQSIVARVLQETSLKKIEQSLTKFISVSDFHWDEDKKPEQHFFNTFQMSGETKPEHIPEPGHHLALWNLNAFTTSDFAKKFVTESDHHYFMRAAANGCCDQEILANGELENKLIKASRRHSGIALETRIMQLMTDEGGIRSQVIVGLPNSISSIDAVQQINFLIDHAKKIGWKPNSLILRHLHPEPEFYDYEKKALIMFIYSQTDLKMTLDISRQFPTLKIIDGATVPNGHTYQVQMQNGKLISEFDLSN